MKPANDHHVLDDCCVFAGVVFLALTLYSAYNIYVLNHVGPKFTPTAQFRFACDIHLFLAVEAAIGYGICLQVMKRRTIHVSQSLLRVIIAAGLFLVGHLVWGELLLELWHRLYRANAPSPVSGLWSFLDDAIGFASVFIVWLVLGAFSAYASTRLLGSKRNASSVSSPLAVDANDVQSH